MSGKHKRSVRPRPAVSTVFGWFCDRLDPAVNGEASACSRQPRELEPARDVGHRKRSLRPPALEFGASLDRRASWGAHGLASGSTHRPARAVRALRVQAVPGRTRGRRCERRTPRQSPRVATVGSQRPGVRAALPVVPRVVDHCPVRRVRTPTGGMQPPGHRAPRSRRGTWQRRRRRLQPFSRRLRGC